MNQSRLEEVRAKLESRARSLRETFERPADQTSAVAPDPAIGRLTRVDAVQAGFLSEAVRRQLKAELGQIERALRRIDDGTYGVCLDCLEPIPDARLEARPDASLCVRCASSRER